MGTERFVGCRGKAQTCGMWHASTGAAVTCGSFCTGCAVSVGTLSLQAATNHHGVEGLTLDWPGPEYSKAEREWPGATSSIRSFLQNRGLTPSQQTHSTPRTCTHSITYVGRRPRQAGRRWRPRHHAAHGGDPPGTAGVPPHAPTPGTRAIRPQPSPPTPPPPPPLQWPQLSPPLHSRQGGRHHDRAAKPIPHHQRHHRRTRKGVRVDKPRALARIGAQHRPIICAPPPGCWTTWACSGSPCPPPRGGKCCCAPSPGCARPPPWTSRTTRRTQRCCRRG